MGRRTLEMLSASRWLKINFPTEAGGSWPPDSQPVRSPSLPISYHGDLMSSDREHAFGRAALLGSRASFLVCL